MNEDYERGYSVGYTDGESSGQATWVLALDVLSFDVSSPQDVIVEVNKLQVKYKRLEEINEQLADTAAKEIAQRDAKLEKLQRHVERLTEQLAGDYSGPSAKI